MVRYFFSQKITCPKYGNKFSKCGKIAGFLGKYFFMKVLGDEWPKRFKIITGQFPLAEL